MLRVQQFVKVAAPRSHSIQLQHLHGGAQMFRLCHRFTGNFFSDGCSAAPMSDETPPSGVHRHFKGARIRGSGVLIQMTVNLSCLQRKSRIPHRIFLCFAGGMSRRSWMGVAVGKTLIGSQRFTAGKMSILSKSGIVKPVCLRRRLEEWQRAVAKRVFSAVIPNQDKRLRGWRCWWGEQMAGVSLGR